MAVGTLVGTVVGTVVESLVGSVVVRWLIVCSAAFIVFHAW